MELKVAEYLTTLLGLERYIGIHSMELKVSTSFSISSIIPAAMNPFNGIERTTDSVTLNFETQPQNPFNGIERVYRVFTL